MPMPTVNRLETPRLLLRPFELSDGPALHALQGDPHVMRYYGNGQALTPEQARVVLDAHIQCRWKSYWAWAVCLKTDTAASIGQVTATPVEWRGEPWIEMCWLLVPSRWRHGYATEAVKQVIEHGVAELKWQKMMAGADVENKPSERVMIKTGMEFAGMEPDAHGKMRRIYTLVRSLVTV